MSRLPESLAVEVAELGEDVERFRRGELDSVAMKSRRVPFGVYEERKGGSYMVRVRCPAGVLTPRQLASVAEAAIEYGSGRLHVTTRAEIQIHGVDLGSMVPIQQKLLPEGLSSRGGGGNTVRNITVSPLSGIDAGEAFDPTPHALALTEFFLGDAKSWALPRKFKIAFSDTPGDTAFARWNDLGFISLAKDGVRGFEVWGAGGMGGKPSRGIRLAEFVPEAEIFACALGLRDLFYDLGNRKNRHAARLRYVKDKLGEAGFRERFGEYFVRAAENLRGRVLPGFEAPEYPLMRSPAPENGPEGYREWLSRHVLFQKQPGLYAVRLTLPLGDIPPEAAKRLADHLAPFGEDTLRLTRRQDMQARNLPGNALPELFAFLTRELPLTLGGRFSSQVVSCTGAATCKLGICNSRAAAGAVFRKLEQAGLSDLEGEASVHISGCPNSCAQHLLAGLGFSGIATRKDERLYPAYSVYAGAVTTGEAPSFAEKIGEVSARDLPGFIAEVAALWRDGRSEGQSLGEWLRTGGKGEAAKLAEAKNRAIPDFRDDRNYYYDWDADEAFSLAGRSTGECSAGLFDFIERDIALVEKGKADWNNTVLEVPVKAEALCSLAHAAARMLLVTRGAEPKTPAEAFAAFRAHFLDTGLAGKDEKSKLRDEAVLALGGREASPEEYIPFADDVIGFGEEVLALYRSMDDSLGFGGKPAAAVSASKEAALHFKDLRGVACPMNFVKTKIELSKLASGEILEIFLDDGEPIKNVPGSVKGEGHAVLLQERDGEHWKLRIRKA
jgi:sulfite reductase (ferredoxin)